MNPKNIFFYKIISAQLEPTQVDEPWVSGASQPFHFIVSVGSA